jgi:hypothetical protein
MVPYDQNVIPDLAGGSRRLICTGIYTDQNYTKGSELKQFISIFAAFYITIVTVSAYRCNPVNPGKGSAHWDGQAYSTASKLLIIARSGGRTDA